MSIDIEQELRLHYLTLIKLAFTYVKNKEMAEDIVQDVCVKAIENKNRFRGDSSYKTYLMKMTINRSYDYLRSWNFRQKSITTFIHQIFGSDSLEQQLLKRDERAQLGNQVLKLKPKYREVLVLYYYEELKIHEIADVLEVSENTVKTRLKRAREQIRQVLDGNGVNLNAERYKEQP